MRIRRCTQIMAYICRFFQDILSGSNQYTLLSQTKSTCQGSCLAKADQNTNHSDFFIIIYRFLFGHLSNILCLFILAVKLAYSDGIVNYLCTPALLVILFFSLLNLLENKSVFANNVPDKCRFLTNLPSATDFPCWKIVKLESRSATGNVTIKSIFILQKDPIVRATAPTILFLQGNSGNIGDRLPLCIPLYKKCGANIFLLQYQGYGYNNGVPSEIGLCADAQAALNYLQMHCNEIDGNNIFIYGHSLGGAVAIDLATRPQFMETIRGTIIENSFCSISDMAKVFGSNVIGSFVNYILPSNVITNKFLSLDKLRNSLKKGEISCGLKPFLFISGNKDELIPPSMMLKLSQAWAVCGKQYDYPDEDDFDEFVGNKHEKYPWMFDPASFIANGTKGLVIFPEGEHNNTCLCDKYHDVYAKFISTNKVPVSSITNIAP